MKKIKIAKTVSEAADHIKKSLQEKGFTIFCDVDHEANAKSVDLVMPASRTLVFGNPMAGTKLMLKDIHISLDLPLRIAIVDSNGETVVLHQSTDDYQNSYDVAGHPVLEKIEGLFSTLISEL